MLKQLDVWLRLHSTVAWVLFRVLAGSLVAVGLFAWLGVWFQRSPLLGSAQALVCILVLANELGLLTRRPRG